METSDLIALYCLDRSDYSSTWCRMQDRVLVQEKREFRHPGFSQSQWDETTEEWADELFRGEIVLIGAYVNEIAVGVAGLDVSQRYGRDSNMFNLGPMWISKKHRGHGIGERLFVMVQEEAERLDIGGLYVSATPVPKTVRFYTKMGCRLLSDPDPQLFAVEPEDIHMCKDLPNRRIHSEVAPRRR